VLESTEFKTYGNVFYHGVADMSTPNLLEAEDPQKITSSGYDRHVLEGNDPTTIAPCCFLFFHVNYLKQALDKRWPQRSEYMLQGTSIVS